MQKKRKPPQSRTTAALAAKLGLSRWTVSRVINGHSGVRPETVTRVRQAMQELGYEPNTFARVLRGGSTGMVGVCFQELESPILARKAGLLQEVFREKGYHALIELSNGDHEREAAALKHFMAMRAEGAVLVGSSLSDAELTVPDSMPVVCVDPENPVNASTISLDRACSMRLALEHLYELGHRRFCSLGIDPEDAYGASRWLALNEHAKKLGILSDDLQAHYQSGFREHTYEYGRTLANALLASSRTLPTALIALNDRVAIGAINALKDNGLEVPKDISVIGYDNIDVSGYYYPKLTTIDQRADHLMRLAAETLISRIEDNSREATNKRVRPRLIVRDSTGLAKNSS